MFHTAFAVALVLAASSPRLSADFAAAPEAVRPMLLSGAAPDVAMRDLDGAAITLKAAMDGKPTVLVFYRGGWCPFCNVQLSELRKLDPDLSRHGAKLIAISPDSAAEIGKTLEKGDIDFTILSDAKGEAMRAFGIGFVVDEKTRETYKGYGIDLAAASGEQHYALPVPSVFVIDAAGIVQFSYVNPDYRTRVPLGLIQAALEAVSSGDAGRALR